MSMNTRTKTIISSAVAGIALLGLTAIPARARNQSVTTLAQAQATPTQAQMNQMMQRCNSMMSMMQGMMGSGHTSGMMGGQNS